MEGRSWLTALTGLLIALHSVPAFGTTLVPDNGSGTADEPLRAAYASQPGSPLQILNGLAPGTTLDSDAVLSAPLSGSEAAGGSLSGTTASGNGMTISLHMIGTGSLAGFVRDLVLPVSFTQDNAPRSPGTSPQTFNTALMAMQGQLAPGDPDFDLLRITAGGSFGLPSPGQTTLTQAGLDWSVDSFFDVTLRIDFIGAPASDLSGQSGSTTGTYRFSVTPEPNAGLLLLLAACVPLAARPGRRVSGLSS